MDFKSKVVIVTGAASGIGAATAIEFAKLNAQVALVDINEESLRKTLAQCEAQSNSKHLAIVVDLSKHEQVLTVIPKTIEHFERIDVLVNAAGILSSANIVGEDVSEKYDLIMSINLKAPVTLTNKAAPYLVESKGNIVNVSSVGSNKSTKYLPLYCSSKAALEMFTKCLAMDLGSKGVRANSVHPGCVRTNMPQTLNPTVDLKAFFKDLENRLPFGIIEPEEIAGLITFLASDKAKNVTGSAYYMDGGITAMNIDP